MTQLSFPLRWTLRVRNSSQQISITRAPSGSLLIYNRAPGSCLIRPEVSETEKIKIQEKKK